MIQINQTLVSTIAKQTDAKSKKGKDNDTLYRIHAASITNMVDLLRDFTEYEMAHFINNNERWIQNRSVACTTSYKRGDILMIDLGAHNFRYEPSFPHPCVVVKATQRELLVVPCSSKKFGKGFPEIIDATPADGFTSNTGVQTTSYRWINKNRVMNKMGQVSNRILNELDTYMLSHIPGHKLLINQKKHEINNLKQKLNSANTKLSTVNALVNQLKATILSKDNEIALLRQQLQAFDEAAITIEEVVQNP